jgi:hypothetical protein
MHFFNVFYRQTGILKHALGRVLKLGGAIIISIKS